MIDEIKGKERPLEIDERLLAAARSAGIPVEETLRSIREHAPQCYSRASTLMLTALEADEKGAAGRLDTLGKTTVLLGEVASRKDRHMVAYGVAALWEMQEGSPEAFASRVDGFFEKYQTLKAAQVIGGEQILAKARRQVERELRGVRPR